ncbi:hypothetical protein [uncultured Weissella sp.]|uniref:hypothetical protein n=1 Tax=uncultured Weissella sp. TaxID=253243 RepID=UPI00258D01B0|nr:hypothetical protein [uncultured Weissella sp.]
MNKFLVEILLIAIAEVVIWFGFTKVSNLQVKLILNVILLYGINEAPLLFMIVPKITSYFKNDIEIIVALLVGIPIYTFLFVPLNLYLFKQEKLTVGDKFFRKSQAVFEILLTMLTFSLLLVTLTSLVSKSLQMDLLIYLLLIYLPALPIIGGFKIKNA